ncbi:MAG: Fe-S-containing hydro-lyase [Ruminococcus sp.]|nr:Fe-S-containing hydro-lyase [Ruminococcus sp.]
MSIKLSLPLKKEDIKKLKAGDSVTLTGELYTARDAAHKRFYEMVLSGEKLPINIKNETIYYVGPAPAKPGSVIGPCGPTSSYRMDKYTPMLLDMGLCAMIGKGERSDEVIDAIKRNGAVYFAAIGGAAALISKSIVKDEYVCFEDLQTESVHKYTVKDFPCIVAIDSFGNDVYK